MKLFDENYGYTEDGHKLDVEIAQAVKSIMHQFIAKGASPRDVEYIATAAVKDISLSVLLLPKHLIGYDSNFGDNKVCKCGHTYERHFNTYDDDYVTCSCKYCDCSLFTEDKNPDIRFPWKGEEYKIPASSYPHTNLIKLPDGLMLEVNGWLESHPPRPKIKLAESKPSTFTLVVANAKYDK